MAAFAMKRLLPVVSKVKFGHNVQTTLEKCKCIYPSATQSFHLRTKRSMACMPVTGPEVKDLSYEDIIELKQKNEIILIDVREPSEIEETGKLPGSVHIPLGELKNALEVLSQADFLKKYGTEKPKRDANLVFSCRTGKRSRTAMETATSIGFLNSRHYSGGFTDWQNRHPS
ncbi:thiosulfate sulfurtransferase/rhodanese-like domain-containing protein 3 [Zootermopsis nevadensis]|uniref:Heat shock protein 67B2 n=1 Tax=Zootermopsis nevadensis TaxID=136037 RepID=A0A067R115_ZOONE|nr:thiosulfate sulfurtransferase/rhodanese-like domain-containing protein 3 [Zootermopsis nevadensis]KDR12490.1 Heat shock protein 67B2 [Zootermopsis nevadensis]